MISRFCACLAALLYLTLSGPVAAQSDGDVQAEPAPTPIEALLLDNTEIIQKSSRKTIQPAIDALRDSGLPEAAVILDLWRNKELWARKADGRFFVAEEVEKKIFALKHVITGEEIARTDNKRDLKQIKPNSGIRALISAALVQFQLQDSDPAKRRDALLAIARDPSSDQLEPLRGSIAAETDPDIRAEKERLAGLLTVRFDEDVDRRVAAITSLSSDLSVDARAALNPLLQTTLKVSADGPAEGENVASTLDPLTLGIEAAYQLLVDNDLAPAAVDQAAIKAALIANIESDSVAGVPVSSLDSDEARFDAYAKLAESGLAAAAPSDDDKLKRVNSHVFYQAYAETDPRITSAAEETLQSINAQVGAYRAVDLSLDALSLASIYFLAAIGLAITFGVMRVINMAHGEFIMMGAYTGYVVQLFIPDYTISIIVALPLAFAVTFAAGVAMERLVIRWLYNRPLETLLATFGISIALQQIAKNIFGTQARPLTSPGWLDGAWVINDVVSISYIRIAIFVLALIFLALLLFILNKTRLGLEVRAVTQNPRMAASMGINPDRINMLTFGLGSGIAGIAGVAIGLFAKVTSELGSDYIVQSFMTVVVGGVGNIWGTLAGATLIGFLQKGIEFFNPSNTLAAQTYMIIFIIIFIQFRPRGIIALKGRAADA